MIYCSIKDPFKYLNEQLQGSDLNKKVFSLALITHLKDRRFQKTLIVLMADSTKVENHFWGKSVGELSKYALDRFDDIDDLRGSNLKDHAAEWLKKSWELELIRR